MNKFIKKVFALLLMLTIVIGINATDFTVSAATTYNITELSGKYKTQGRTAIVDGALMLDWSVIAKSGITAGNGFGWSGATSVSMQKVYPKTRYYSDENTQYDFKRQPDVIVLGLGTNDMWTYSNANATIDDVEKGFKDMLNLLRTKNPNSKIVWIYGMMISKADNMIQSVILEMGGSEKGYYSLKLNKNTSGGQGHPNLAVQQVYAENLVNFLNTYVLKDSPVTSKPTTSNNSSSSTVLSSSPSQSVNNANSNNSTASSQTQMQSGNITVDTSSEDCYYCFMYC